MRSGDAAATGDLVQGTNFARQAVTSYVDVVDSAVVLDRVIARTRARPDERRARREDRGDARPSTPS